MSVPHSRTRVPTNPIRAVQSGGHNPHPILVREIARALDLPEADLAAIAGVDHEVPDAANPADEREQGRTAAPDNG